MDRAALDDVIQLVTEKLSPVGYCCIESEWIGDKKILRVFIDQDEESDREEPGIKIEDCVQATRILNDDEHLDEVVPGSYTLEVSSPGIERPLRRPVDFSRFLGSEAQVKLNEVIAGRRKGSGTIEKVEPLADRTTVTLLTDTGEWVFPLRSLKKATLVYEWRDA